MSEPTAAWAPATFGLASLECPKPTDRSWLQRCCLLPLLLGMWILSARGVPAQTADDKPLLPDWLLYLKPIAARPGTIAWLPVWGNSALASVEGVDANLDFSQPASLPPLAAPAPPADVIPGERFTGGSSIANWNSPGTVHFGVIDIAPTGGAGIYAVLPLAVPADALPGSVYTLTLYTGKVVVASMGEDLEYRVPTSGATLEVATPVLGDANGDGRLSIADAVLVIRFALGTLTPTPVQALAADVNGDAAISLDDVRMLLRMLVGEASSP